MVFSKIKFQKEELKLKFWMNPFFKKVIFLPKLIFSVIFNEFPFFISWK